MRSTARFGGVTFPSGRELIPPLGRLCLDTCRYLLRRKKYPHFRLRALLALRRKGVTPVWRIARLNGFYYGSSLRTPRWPSPAFDRMVANGGMNLDASVIADKHQIDSVIISVTRRCAYDCRHCYDAANRAARDTVPVDRWSTVIRQVQQLGASVIILSGGEPMLRYESILALLDRADRTLSDFHIHTSGAGVTAGRAGALASHGLVAAGIGLDFPDALLHDRFRGRPGAFRGALQALEAFAGAGVFTYTNLCLTHGVLRDGGLSRYMDLARSLGVGTVQILEPKPCGKYGGRDPGDLLSEEERARARAFFFEANRDGRRRGWPPVAYTAHFERPENFGCLMGGISHFSIDGRGNVNPCVYLPVSFGNVMDEDFTAIFDRMRSAVAGPLYRGCPAVLLGPAVSAARGKRGVRVVEYGAIREEWRAALSE